ncbi:hypothetical protein LTR17_026947 [Elasticomyces elasticus]|nr:hypothetical protein LTR17_026947 [Elasticomyces elasticus]
MPTAVSRVFRALLAPIQLVLHCGRASHEPAMDDVVRQSIAIVEQSKKGAVPWDFDEPYEQPYFRWIDEKWQAAEAGIENHDRRPVDKFAVMAWNIDFMIPFDHSRMVAAIRHLEKLVSEEDDLPTIILLNECLQNDLKTITSDDWVRSRFHVTDMNAEYWQSGFYGTTTLIDRRLAVESCFRVHFAKTRMERDGLFVDIDVGAQKPVRLCNTHTESLALEPPFRPSQLAICAKQMHSEDVHGAVLAGDLNAIQDFDKTLHTDNDLKDAYLELGGNEDDPDGHTWGQQAATVQRERFGTTRMDKVLFCGKVECRSFERFGMDVQLEDEEEREKLTQLGFDKPWITDHLGVKAIFVIGTE